MRQVQKYSPMQGTHAFTTVSFPIVKTFRLTATGMSDENTSEMHTFKKGSIVLGFQGKVTTAFAATGKIQLGFTGASMLSVATEATDLTGVGTIMGPSTTSAGTAQTYVLTADDTFDAINTTGALTAGEMDIHVLYVPPPDGEAPSTYKQYNLT